MKKNLSALMAAAMVLGTMNITVSADEALSAEVYVTIADENGKLAVVQEKVTVTDNNSDGILSIDEALFAAHEAKFDGGAAAGYASDKTDYGFSLNKLWGAENGGSYGYYLNNSSAMSLSDEVKSGDYVNAYVYTDLTAWSDTYCFFDKNTAEGGEVTLTLSAAGWDESYNPVTLPVEGAVITINGKKTEFVTDADGKATITINEAGSYVVSAVSDTQTLVPPSCKVTAAASEEATAENASPANPATGVEANAASVILFTAAAITLGKVKKSNEK